MRKFFLIVFLIFSTSCLSAQYLSDASSISLLTASPGEELYSTFGHSAIRITDPSQNLDIVFNFGTFDDSIPYFYVKFARRKVDYMLTKPDYERFILGYVYENRSIIEQKLNLNSLQKKQLYAQLLNNYKPENRFYRYDFFFDNCSTRIRDLMLTTFGDDFSYHYPEAWMVGNYTFRNLIDLYLTHHHWSDFGIDLGLGLPTDDIASPADYMFLPDYLMQGFATATIVQDGESQPLVVSTQEILGRKNIPSEDFFISPLKVCWTLFIVTVLLSVYSYKNGHRYLWYDMILFSVIGLVGWVVFFLDFATDHIATKENLNLLWAIPIHLPIILFWNKIPMQVKKIYVWLCLTICVVILGFWKVFPQNYHIAFIPLILSMIVRYLIMIKVDFKPKRV